eukprot:c18584_g1_i2.p1 GENE.c18584_g1_i2~~c18584_g1_i2.p1  ORF type:complete len:176 (+),score=28.26 c18584_g1_i2:35-562(+)
MSGTKKAFDCDIVGFDLDHTVCRYRLDEFFGLIYSGLREYLITQFDERLSALLSPDYDMRYSLRGSVLDFSTGDLIWLDPNGRVTCAQHGERRLKEKEIQDRYPGQWVHFHTLCLGSSSTDFLCAGTFFEVPCLYLFTQVKFIPAMTNRALNVPSEYLILIDWMFSPLRLLTIVS